MKEIILIAIFAVLTLISWRIKSVSNSLQVLADNTAPPKYEYQVNIDENWMYIYGEGEFIGRVPFNQCPICDSIFIADNQ